MYSALEKLYGLKLFDGLITEDKIPARFKTAAMEYAKSLMPSQPEEPETPEIPDNTETPKDPTLESNSGNNENTEQPEETPKTDEAGTNEFNFLNALSKAEPNSTITLPENVHLIEDFSVNKVITIDLNGHDITSNASVIYLRSANADLTITGTGNIRAGTGGDYFAARAASGKLNISGGNWFVGADAEGKGNSCIYASGSGKINISGGEFSTEAPYNGKYFVLNRKNGSDSAIKVSGGFFYNYNPISGDDNDGGNFVVDGYTSSFNEAKQAWEVIPAVVETKEPINNEEVTDNPQTENTEEVTSEDVTPYTEDITVEENTNNEDNSSELTE